MPIRRSRRMLQDYDQLVLMWCIKLSLRHLHTCYAARSWRFNMGVAGTALLCSDNLLYTVRRIAHTYKMLHKW